MVVEKLQDCGDVYVTIFCRGERETHFSVVVMVVATAQVVVDVQSALAI
jgi:hypothetical protein